MKVIDWIKKHEYECRDGFCLTWAEDQLGGFGRKGHGVYGDKRNLEVVDVIYGRVPELQVTIDWDFYFLRGGK